MHILNSKDRQIIYGAATVAGIIATWFFNIRFFLEHKTFPLSKFILDNYINSAYAVLHFSIMVCSKYIAQRYGQLDCQ